MRMLFVFLMLFAANGARANCMDTNEGDAWKQAYPTLYSQLVGLFTCRNQPEDPAACNVFVGRAAEAVYNVTDFKNSDGSYMTADHIMDIVAINSNWSKLGNADSQDVLNNAASGAGDHLIIAASRGDPHGHVALVLPGDTRRSGTWGLNVPNSASAFLGDVNKAYVFCQLSRAFKVPGDVEIWWRPKGAP